MSPSNVKYLVAGIVFLLFANLGGKALDGQAEQHTLVSMRMIGHQILLDIGDSTSRVLPIEKVEGRYKIQFDTQFDFVPDSLVSTINKVLLSTQMTSGYIMEVLSCETDKVVYSYEIGNLKGKHMIPCRGRDQPKACYYLLFTLIENEAMSDTLPISRSAATTETVAEENRAHYALFALPVMLLAGVVLVIRKKQQQPKPNPNLIAIGDYQFDTLSAELILGEERVELTSKKADLLMLLHDNLNQTVERGVILNKVWGDEGDYVGRTLDVFISKLRKRLEADPKVKIVNVRGVGYKLVVGG